MSPLVTFFGDAEYPFALPFNLAMELERVCESGIGRIASRVMQNAYSLADLQHTVRLALIGGGLDPRRAAELVDTYAPRHGVVALQLIAIEVLERLFAGDDDQDSNQPQEGLATEDTNDERNP